MCYLSTCLFNSFSSGIVFFFPEFKPRAQAFKRWKSSYSLNYPKLLVSHCQQTIQFPLIDFGYISEPYAKSCTYTPRSLALRSKELKRRGPLRARHPGEVDSFRDFPGLLILNGALGQAPLLTWLGWLIPITKAEEGKESRSLPYKTPVSGGGPPHYSSTYGSSLYKMTWELCLLRDIMDSRWLAAQTPLPELLGTTQPLKVGDSL